MAQKYIIGDLVKYKVGGIEFIAEITNTSKYGYCFKGVSDDISGTLCKEFAKDIPLTPEILEKNGWDKEEKDGSVFSLSEAFMGGDKNDENNYTCFQLYYQNKKDGWVIDMRGEPLKFGVHYIHELQHLFFGLGINSEMGV